MMDVLKIICVLIVLAGGLVLLWEVVAVVLDVLWQSRDLRRRKEDER